MKRKVFVSSCSVKAPGISDIEKLQTALIDPGFDPSLLEVMLNKDLSGYFGSLDLDTTSSYYPDRQDIKIMRNDVVASTICVSELLENTGIREEDLSNIPLFIANGIVIEKLFDKNDKVSRLFFEAILLDSTKKKLEKLYKIIPPLLALQTLTNATESYVAQYSGIAGNNTTFGNTSISAYYALLEGFRNVESGKSNLAVIGASNSSGEYSNLTFRQFTSNYSGWRESACSVFLLLESSESLKRHQKKALCEIVQLKSSNHIPELLEISTRKPFESLISEISGDLAVFSGGFTENDYELEKKEVKAKSKKSYSWFPKLGNLGAGAILMNIITAICLLKNNSVTLADCLDRDPYSRESLVKIRVC
ncbi:MAG: hypothetical protein KAX05_05455 [Bacteroidales bacterium]|nr:hypothetical protein [Bacteroidales bacterium]